LIPLPELIPAKQITCERLAISGTPSIGASFTFQDPGGKRFYFLDWALIKNNDLRFAVFSTLKENSCYDSRLFNNLCFVGAEAKIAYRVRIESQFKGSNKFVIADSISLRFGAVSEELFIAHQNSLVEDEGLINDLGEPAISYSNVKGGHGVVYAVHFKDYVFPVCK
jgi:Domain of unknown function (DUF4249)